MSKLAGLAGGQTVGIAGAATAVVVGGALYVGGAFTPEPTDPQPEPAALVQTEEEATQPVVETEVEADTASSVPPSISTFRLESDGQMLISGRSQPGWDVTVLIDDAEMATFPTDGSGEFAQFLSIELSDMPRILKLSAKSPDTGEVLASLEDIIIAPMEPGTAVAQVVEEVPEEEATEEAGETEETTSTAVLVSDEEGVSLLQAPEVSDASPELMSVVALDTITYSDAGDVQLSGRGLSDGFVRVYLDNTPVTSSRIEEDGNWRSDLPEVDTGVYTLRIDEVDEDGNVTSRVETPFKREDKEIFAQEESSDPVRAITVQAGNTLWAISRERYGEGTAYVRIFEANRDRIRNPDLIYPGQVFTIPQ